MNYRKGIIRIYIIWFIVWAAVFWLGWTRERNGNIIMTDKRYSNIFFQGAEVAHSGQFLQLLALFMALVLPILLLLVLFLFRWVSRGFRDKPKA